METLREKQIQEAVKRMKELKIMGNVIKDFKNKQIVYYSERMDSFFDGILYWLHNHEEYVTIKEVFEGKTDYLVYHAQLVHTNCGDMLTFLYVSNKESAWEKEETALKSGKIEAYVYNLDLNSGETGLVGIKPLNGGITRTF